MTGSCAYFVDKATREDTYNVASGYNANNVVVISRYVSKMVTQISKQRAIFDFYSDILTFDAGDAAFTSKEVYIKQTSDFFEVMPPACTVADLVRSVFVCGFGLSDAYENHTLLLGYVHNSAFTLFTGD